MTEQLTGDVQARIAWHLNTAEELAWEHINTLVKQIMEGDPEITHITFAGGVWFATKANAPDCFTNRYIESLANIHPDASSAWIALRNFIGEYDAIFGFTGSSRVFNAKNDGTN